MLNLLCRKSAKHSQSTQSTLKIQIPRKMDEKQNAHSCCYSSDVERMEHVLQIKRISDTKKKKKKTVQNQSHKTRMVAVIISETGCWSNITHTNTNHLNEHITYI